MLNAQESAPGRFALATEPRWGTSPTGLSGLVDALRPERR
jgi:hypothetical protein